MILYKKGNLMQASEDIIAHGCNCINGFGSGVAGDISKEYPQAKIKYHEKFNTVGWKLGDVQIVKTKGKQIANCATQYEYYPRNKQHADYDAIQSCFNKLYTYSKNNNLTIAIPKIGAGLAGGDWIIIESIINRVFHDKEIVCYLLDK
jgi:O-acetyl-ADP-ribose deacetylase (regulator of RNase III)